MRKVYYQFADGTTTPSYQKALASGKRFETRLETVRESKPNPERAKKVAEYFAKKAKK